ncbi:MAG: hypothetical protein IRZ31_15860 [Thermogemmatispora sp.]|uniref:hypothetical protein n=1 Tax=Thermogemmatispora sp. TaxID=1968838 RepID=UPI002606D83C|nr:hypothetical protein [Thermogemmatispora sp.]MBX5458369.1 hypothetical protein [Thermogemmatispora sp.]
MVPPTWFPSPPSTAFPSGMGMGPFPPYSGPAPLTAAPAPPPTLQQPWWLPLAITFFIVASLASCGLTAFLAFQQASQSLSQSLSQSVSPATLETAHQTVVQDYYTAIQQQQYQSAYIELASDATVKGQHLDLNGYLQLARAQDQRFGKVSEFSVNELDPYHFTVTVWRDLAIYEVHLTFATQALPTLDRITSVDGI